MFYFNTSPIIDVSGLDTSSVTNMAEMFSSTFALEELDLSSFDTTSVTTMSSMFNAAGSVSGSLTVDLSGFNTSSVTGTGFEAMFSFTYISSIDVTGFDTSGATSLFGMFFNNPFLETISGVSDFDTSNVTNMDDMFGSNSNLTGIEIDQWDVSSLASAARFMDGSDNAIDTAQYDQILLNWSAQSLQNDVVIDFGNTQFTGGGAVEAAKAVLTDTYQWVITDGGPV